MVEAPEAPHTPFMHPVPRGWGGVVTGHPPVPSPLKNHIPAKFHPDPSSDLDFCREVTYTQTNIALYVLED